MRPAPSHHQACTSSCWATSICQMPDYCSPWWMGVACPQACRSRCAAKALPTHALPSAAPGATFAHSGWRVECWDGSSTCVRGPVWASPASTVYMLSSHSLHLSAQGRSWMVGMVIGMCLQRGCRPGAGARRLWAGMRITRVFTFMSCFHFHERATPRGYSRDLVYLFMCISAWAVQKFLAF